MKNRRSIVFFLLIIALLATALIISRPSGAPVRAERRQTLVEKTDDIRRLQLVRRGSPSVELVRSRGWRMTNPFAASVEESRVHRLLDALAFTPVSDAYADADLLRLGRTRAGFGLEAPPISLSLVDGKGVSTSLSFGSPTPTGDGIYAAVEGVGAVFVVPSAVLAAVDLRPEDLRRRALFPKETETPTAFDIKRGTASLQTFELTAGGWTVGGESVSSQKVKDYLHRLTSAVAVDFVWPVGASNETEHATTTLLSGYGLDPENAVTLTLKGADGTTRQISFGKAAGEQHVYALVHHGAAIVTVPAELKETAVTAGVTLTDSRLFPVETAAVSAFTVSDGTVSCALARDGNDGWRLESPISAPADAVFVEALLSRLVSLSTADRDAEGVRISLGTNQAPVSVSFRRLFGSGDFASFRSKQILNVDPTIVRRLVRTPGGTDVPPTVVVYNRERRAWGFESEAETGAVDEQAVAAVLKAIAPLTARRIVKLKAVAADLDDYGLDAPSFTLAIDQEREDAVRRNLLIGAKTDGGSYATVGSADAVFVLSDETVRQLTLPFVANR